jgi:hypothetical protein
LTHHRQFIPLSETGNGMIVQGVAQEADARLLPAPQQCLQAEFEVGLGEHGLDRCTGELVSGG